MRDQPGEGGSMTEPRDIQHDQAEAADSLPEVKPEFIADLDVTGEDADDIAGGAGYIETTPTHGTT
jgi:hypothetical protein